MRFTTTGVVCALLLNGAIASAQDRSVKTETKVKSDNGSVETLTGCVMIGGATNFLLTNITARAADDKKPSSSTVSYALMERDGVDLGQYINQRVQLTGVFVPAATKGDRDDKFEVKETKKADANSGSGKTTSTRQTVKVDRGAANQFIVAAVKAIAPQCEQ
jgi:hypothetical protein